jgi:endoglucanase
MKLKLTGCLTALASLMLAAGVASAALPALHTSGNKIYDASGNVVILRGCALIDLGSLQDWEGGVTAAIDRLTNPNDTSGSSPGFYTKVVRLVIGPPGSGGPWLWSPTDGGDYYNNLLRPVVNYCASKNIYCIIDFHYVQDISSANAATATQFWTYIAPLFKNDANVLFELYNEPVNNQNGSDLGNWNAIKGYYQSWYNIVRNAGAPNLCIIGSPNYSATTGTAAQNPLSGYNIAYTCHLYPQHWSSSWNVSQFETAAPLQPVFVTEWGFGNYPGNTLYNSTISAYGQPFMNQMNALGVSWTAWVADTSWQPAMFASGWVLLVGQNQMGGFVKDTLYSLRNSNQPGGSSGNLIANGTYTLLNVNSGLALDDPGYVATNGTPVDQWAGGGGNNQKWQLTNLGNNVIELVNLNSGKALEVAGFSTANGATVDQWSYSGGANQQWTVISVGSGAYELSNKNSGQALDVSGASTANGGRIIQWPYSGGANQKWTFH